MLRACFKNTDVKIFRRFWKLHMLANSDGSLSNQVNLRLEQFGKKIYLSYSFMKLYLKSKTCLAFTVSDNRHTSRKYNKFSSCSCSKT